MSLHTHFHCLLQIVTDFVSVTRTRLFRKSRVLLKNYHSIQIFLPFHWLRAHHVTCK